jgi:hypothetical protein
MRRIFVIFALLATPLVLAPAPVRADDYGPTIWCNFTITGLPGGTVNQRLAFSGFNTDPLTTMTKYLVGGFDTGNNADVSGYGHTGPGFAFPFTVTVTAGPTLAAIVRHYYMTLNSNLAGPALVVDILPAGTFSATGTASVACPQ